MDLKERIGNWEVDLIIGLKQKGAILTIVERVIQFVFLFRSKNGKEYRPLADQFLKLLEPHKQVIHTISYDNGGEFADNKCIANNLNAHLFFAHHYSS